MLMRRITAFTVAVVLAFAGPLVFAQQPSGQLAGTAKDEAKKPYSDYFVRARVVNSGVIAATAPLDDSAKWVLPSLPTDRYVVELVQAKNNVVCTEGPFALTPTQPQKNDVNISCGVPALVWLLPAAAAAGIAVAVTRGPASPSR